MSLHSIGETNWQGCGGRNLQPAELPTSTLLFPNVLFAFSGRARFPQMLTHTCHYWLATHHAVLGGFL